MIKTLLVQSGKEKKNRLADLFKEHFPAQGDSFIATNLKDAESVIRKQLPHLVIMDVSPSNGIGFQLFENTSDFSYEKIIICENSEFAIKALRYNVADYLLKPLSGEQLFSAIEKLLFKRKDYKIQQLYAAKFLRQGLVKLNQILVEGDDLRKLVNVSEVVRIAEGRDNTCLIHLLNAPVLHCDYSLDRLTQLLMGTGIVRINQDQLISVRYVAKICACGDGTKVVMLDGHEAELGFQAERIIRYNMGKDLPETLGLDHRICPS